MGPTSWRSRTIRRDPDSARDATTLGGVRDKRRRAVLAVIVRGMGSLGSDERSHEEQRARKAVLHMRSCLFALLHTGKLATTALPVVLDVDWDRVSVKGTLGRLMEGRLRELVGAAAAEGPAAAQQRGRALPKAPKHIKASDR